MKITEKWVSNPATQAVFDVVEGAGHAAYFVGGCVRNALLGEPVGDIDLSTTATPDDMAKAFAKAAMKLVPTGVDHGTVTVLSGGTPHEITTFRKDVETDGRRAVVAFSKDIADDARRRDFTINALYAQRDGTVIDPLGGLDDLNARRIRFIEDAAKRIEEDHLRTLRFFRFHAWYANDEEGFDADALDAIARHLDGLSVLSPERVGHEFIKMLSAPNPTPAVAVMAQIGVLARLLSGADPRFLGPLCDLDAAFPANPIRRLAALGGEDVADRLRLSRKQARELAEIREIAQSSAVPAELGYRFGAGLALDGLLVRAAMLETPLPEKAQDDIARGASATLPVSAADLLPGLSGPALGARLKEMEDQWIKSGFTLDRDALLAR